MNLLAYWGDIVLICSIIVTLDYKGLLLIMTKIEEDSVLGGKGLMVEFCIFCLALRACDCDLGPNEVCLEHFLQTKANIGRFKGLRDDLTCILDEELTSVCLCALHCEMRNTEQMLKSVGLIAYQIGSLQECNEKLSNFGPSNFNGDRISVKLKQGQQTAPERNNISVASFSGNTERQILSAIEEIVEESLPVSKMTAHYKDPETAKLCVLNKITFCEARQKYYREMLESGVFVRDHGTRLEELQMKDSAVSKELECKLEFWRGKQLEIEGKFKDVYSTNLKAIATSGKSKTRKTKKKGQTSQEKECSDHANYNLSSYAASLIKEFLIKVCSEWKEIALVIRDAHFSEDEEHLIDIFDVKCKEWGFLLLEMFGRSLGTGDYGHLTIEHVPMLFRIHRSLQQLSNQGFEAAHKLQRQLYAKATSHDASNKTASLEQIFTHLYMEKFLEMRYTFREAVNFVNSGKVKFYYRGCGWKPKQVHWTEADKEWIRRIDKLFSDLFGPDFCQYESDEKKICILSPGQFPLFKYNHDEWEESYVLTNVSGDKEKSSQGSSICAARNESTSSGSNISNHLNPVSKKLVSDGDSSSCGDKSSHVVNLVSSGLDSDHDSSALGEKRSQVLNLVSKELDSDGESSACGDRRGQVANPFNSEARNDCASSLCNGNSSQAPNDSCDEVVRDCDQSSCSSKRNQVHQQMPAHTHPTHTAKSNKVGLTVADFHSGKLDGLNRKDRAAYLLPGVVFISPQDVLITKREEKASNPLLAKQRPSEGTVEVALNLLKKNSDSLVKIGNLGYYTAQSVKVFAKMCALASEALKLKEELRWLSQTPPSPETVKVREVLENSRPNDVVLQQGCSIMDVKDFSSLACERYVNSFAIDTICLTILRESKEMDIVYLPCYSQTWAKQGPQFFNHKVSSYFDSCPVDRARVIFLPLHFPRQKHWGLVCFDTTTKTVFFDDGLKIIPTRDILTVVKNMLSGFENVSNDSRFKLDKWNNGKLSLPFPRIGMPSQTTVGVGAGSCGVAVILSFRDIVRSGFPPSFQWEFSEMGHLRKELMSLALQWRT